MPGIAPGGPSTRTEDRRRSHRVRQGQNCQGPGDRRGCTYDARTDTLTIVLRPGPVSESDENKPGVILDDDDTGRLIGLEILDASKTLPDGTEVRFHRTE